ncbi:beta-ketoacyl-ACP synthase II [Lacticaseibacillus thailandensis]|uniref:3-oxoacyl-[acyl-carrier-protein] synthase 2 n=1 Tax=Lacticaseibacillus thailandensis DSM 22698 = JCM 13996 TaxID=1423810 RepID=A0A0R2C8J8_9LACO|nr:beta-ketoacyl-ACP synthase II [Lacticaseibacillus thailandensis]KRM87895.1 fabF protein [Lacticaseibacillus thailandensis DSM 22698 = JCM 13996]
MKRVVITGMGAVTPLGNTLGDYVAGLRSGRVGIGPITKFAADAGVSVAGEVRDFDPTVHLKAKAAKRMDLFSQYALYSATEAMTMAGLVGGGVDSEQFGVIYGSGIGGLGTIEQQVIKMHDKGPRRVSPLFVPNAIINMAAGNLSIAFHAQNISQAVVTACASATNAIGNAFDTIRLGRAQVMLTGGSEASVNEIGIAGFAALTALSRSTDPLRASLPFDAYRSGFVMGEGAGTLVLEELTHAQARDAHIYAEVVGYGSTADAYHATAPDPTGTGAIRAMTQAVTDAGITPDAVGYINAHGTATKANDEAESRAIQTLFGKHDVLVSSTKGMTGHLLGAAGALEAIATVAALRGPLPVNVGCADQDPACPVHLVTPANADRPVDYALSNSFGFGGHNAVLAFKRWGA